MPGPFVSCSDAWRSGLVRGVYRPVPPAGPARVRPLPREIGKGPLSGPGSGLYRVTVLVSEPVAPVSSVTVRVTV
ncbi:hypothetical protein GCM10007079_19210 [Nocardiopsis terrae]|nr:hypothetical protein GCM10007079_19210 [Nocardiopsis terrae]